MIRPPILVQYALQLDSNIAYAISAPVHFSPRACDTPALGASFAGRAHSLQVQFLPHMKSNKHINEAVETCAPAGKTASGAHRGIRDEVRGRKAETLP